MVFIDSEKACDGVPRKLILWVLKKTQKRYMNAIKDMYDDTLVINDLISHIQVEIQRGVLFVNDFVLVDEGREGVNNKLKTSMKAPKSKGINMNKNGVHEMQL